MGMVNISLACEKGGVSKTTTAWTLASCLRQKGFRVLLVDLDQQRNLSGLLDANTKTDKTSLALFRGIFKARDVIQHTKQGDIIAAGRNLQALDMALKDVKGKEYYLKLALDEIKSDYDFCIIDCPPSLGTATVNALTASDCVIIPIEAAGFALDGLDDIAETVARVKKDCNPKLKIAGILLTRFEANSNLSKASIQIAAEQAKRLKTKVFSVPIRNSVRVRESQMLHKDLFEHAEKSNPAADYRAFTEELLQDLK